MASRAGGESLDAQATTLEILRGLGKATARQIAGGSKLSHSSTKHALTALRRGDYVEREKVVGSRAFMYWISPNGPLELPRSPRRNRMRTQAMVLQTVVDAGEKVTSVAIAKVMGLTRTTVGLHLRELCDKGILNQHKAAGQRGNMYWGREGADVDSVGSLSLSTEDKDALWWAPITEALARTRPTWRMPPQPTKSAGTSLLSGFDKRKQLWYNEGA